MHCSSHGIDAKHTVLIEPRNAACSPVSKLLPVLSKASKKLGTSWPTSGRSSAWSVQNLNIKTIDCVYTSSLVRSTSICILNGSHLAYPVLELKHIQWAHFRWSS